MVATLLRRGQLAIIQVDSEDSDDPNVAGIQNMARDTVSFVLLAPVGAGTVIYFTDRTWTPIGSSGSFGVTGADGTLTWTAASDLPAGTVITLTQAELTAAGINLADTGEVVWAFQGPNANTPTTFLFALEYGDGNDIFNASLVNTGLSVGTGAAAVAEDNISYGERIHNQNAPVLFTNLSDHTNWHTNENSPQNDQIEGTNLAVAPDIQLWIAGISGGHGLISVSGDATQNGGLGYNVQTHFQNTSNDGNGLTSTQRFHSPTHILFDTVANRFFVVDSTGGIDRILQGNISDLLTNPGVAPTMTILWSDKPAVQDGDGITSIQIDRASGHIYFTADNTLLRVNYNTADQTAVVLANFGLDPDSGSKNFTNELALDLANGRAFVVSTELFSSFISVPAGTPGAIPDGDGWALLVTTVSQNSLHMVTGISPSDTNATGNVIVQLNFDAAYNEKNGFYGAQINEFDDAFGRITDVQVNSLTGEIWFTTVQISSVAGSVGGIYKATLSGTTLTVTQIYAETSATNQNFFHINVDEETGFYYVTSVENGQGGNHAVYRGSLGAAPGTAPTFFATVGNINELTPRDLTIESAPTLTGSAIAGLAVTEASSAPLSGETARVFLYQSLVADDIDTGPGDELAGAQVRISSGLVSEPFPTAPGHSVGLDILSINGTTSGTIAGSGITYSYNQTTGILTLSGAATTAEYAAALQLVQFSTRGDNITNNGDSVSRTISASVFDGLMYSDEIQATVAVTGINDAPVNTVGAAASFTEDTVGASGVAVPVNAITGVVLADADADQTTDLFTVTLSVANGTLTIRTGVVGGLPAGNVVGNGTGTIVLTGTETQINTTLQAVNGSSLANGLVYTPNANFNGADRLTMVTNDQGNSGNDPGLTGTGTTEQDSDTKVLNVADVNDAPTVVDATQDSPAILEDVPFTNLNAPTVTSLFGASFSDALDVQQTGGNPTGSAGDTLAGIAIVSATANANGAWQYWDGDSWENIGAGTQAAARTLAAGTQLRFNPTLNYNGPAPALTVHLIESGGAAITNNGTVNLSPVGTATGGTTIYSSAAVVLSQTVTSVNDAPVIANLSGDVAIYTEQQSPTLLESGNALLTDVDSANFDTGTLTVAIGTGLVAAQDELLIRTTSGISTSGNAVFYNATQIGTFTGAGSGGGPLVVTFDADATLLAVQSLLRAIGYTNSGGDNPTAGVRTINWTLVDGDGTANTGVDTVTRTTTVTVVAINDSPQGADASFVLSEDGSRILAQGDFGFSDVDANGFAGVVITTLPTNGVLLLNGVPITVAGPFITAVQIAGNQLVFQPDANENGVPYATFTFQVRDDGGTAGGGQNTDQSANTTTFDVTAVNDAPVVTIGGLPGATEQIPVSLKSTISVADIDAGAGQLTLTLAADYGVIAIGVGTSGATLVSGNGTGTTVVSGTLAQLTALLSNDATSTITYTADTDAPPASANLTASVSDNGNTGSGGARTGSGTAAIAITTVNDPAVANPDSAATDENAAVAIAVLGNDTDPDGPAPAVTHIGGQAVSVGGSVMLASGATATLNANGTITYDPNGKFNQLISQAKATATGASNTSATDSFTYTLVGGATAGVTVTVNGVDSADDRLQGTAEDDTMTGTPLGDLFMLQDDGEDTISGGDGDDGFYMGTALCAGDVLNGGAGNDQVGLQGNYGAFGFPWVFETNNFINIETLVLLPGNDTRFGDLAGNLYSYSLRTVDGNVASGAQMTVSFNRLRAGENVGFDGSAETDGHFLTYGGLGNDTIIGGQQSDGFFFGFGRWGIGDSVDGQGGTLDQLGLQGVYTGANAITFGASQIANLEMIVLISGGDTRFGSGGAPYAYDITMNDGNLAGGATMAISANGLRADETLTFNGAAETDGRFLVYGGLGNDVLIGGAGNDEIWGGGGADTITGGLGADTLRGGAGDDIFAYLFAADSSAARMDRILDFATGDRINLTAIDADGNSGNGDTAFSYIGASAFTGIAGQLRAFLDGGIWKVEGDTDGDGIADLVIEVTTPGGHELAPADFWL